MTCKDCIHEKVCDALIKSGCPYLDEEVPADAFCIEFRNTADVAPREEVGLYRKQVDELEDELASTYDKLENAKVEVARKIFADIENVLNREYTEIEQRRARIKDHDALDGIDGELCGLDYAMQLVTECKEKYTDATDTNDGHKEGE